MFNFTACQLDGGFPVDRGLQPQDADKTYHKSVIMSDDQNGH